jgi:hypothetical protein
LFNSFACNSSCFSSMIFLGLLKNHIFFAPQ